MADKTQILHFQEAGAGKPVLLIHGFPFSGAMWARQLASLSGDAHVIAPDLPGFGFSPIGEGAYTVERYAEDCVAVLDALDITEPIVLGGLSMGGYTALAFARKFPERLSALMLLSTRAGADSSEGKANRDKTIANVKENGASVVTEAMYPKLLAPGSYAANPAAAEELQQIMRSATPEGVVGALSAMRDRADSTAMLASIKVPTLIVHGLEDQVIPYSEAEAMAKAIPNSKLELIEGAGHMPGLEQQAAFDRALSDFLRGL